MHQYWWRKWGLSDVDASSSLICKPVEHPRREIHHKDLELSSIIHEPEIRAVKHTDRTPVCWKNVERAHHRNFMQRNFPQYPQRNTPPLNNLPPSRPFVLPENSHVFVITQDKPRNGDKKPNKSNNCQFLKRTSGIPGSGASPCGRTIDKDGVTAVPAVVSRRK